MRAFRILLGAWIAFYASAAWGATTILPPAKTCFSTATGAVSAGTVNMFFPGTTTPKPTWQDSNQTALNPQPVVLDANGCALIFGVGAYRQQLFTSTGSLIFDAITTDTSAYNSVFWSGINGGTPNVITIIDTGFNGTDGTVINFTALATNTGPTTINPSGFGAINVVKDTAAGPVSLTGGEIIQNNIISVIYSASGNNFHLINTAIPSAAGTTAPLCGATNLNIVNNSGTPNSIITITADSIVLTTPAGLVVNRSAVSQNINITSGTVTSTAGGMDGESPGTSSWIYLWLIDNGAAPAGLATLSSGFGLTPNMPSGYSYKCRVGAMRVFSDGTLMRTTQRGITAQYVLTPATGTAALPTVVSGNSGNPAVPTWTTVSLASVVPPTAAAFTGSLVNANNGTSVGMVAPNGNYGSIASTTIPPPVAFNAVAATDARLFTFTLESLNIFYAASGGNTAQLYAFGWKDHVNAN